MKEVIFKGSCLQVGDRVKIPKAIIDTLGICKGCKIVVRFDSKKKKVVIEEQKQI